jgi:hypothetical protein
MSTNAKPFAPELKRIYRAIVYLFIDNKYGTVNCDPPIN